MRRLFRLTGPWGTGVIGGNTETSKTELRGVFGPEFVLLQFGSSNLCGRFSRVEVTTENRLKYLFLLIFQS